MSDARLKYEAVLSAMAAVGLVVAVAASVAVASGAAAGGYAPAVLTGALLLGGIAGRRAAWWQRHLSEFSAVNLYLAFGVAVLVVALMALLSPPLVLVAALLPLVVASGSAAVFGEGWRREEGGAGGELRDHSQRRVMLWERDQLVGRPRRIVGPQGELITKQTWPDPVDFVPMGSDADSPRVPRGQGQHILILGGTGSGKTVSAGRITLARVLADGVPALVLDPKADEDLRASLAAAANAAKRPFIVFDPDDEDTDRWDPVWSPDPGRTVARLLSPIQSSEPYYADTLRIHLGVVAEALRVLGLWPASLPLLLAAAQAHRFGEIQDMVNGQPVPPELARRVEDQAALVSSREGQRDLLGGAERLKVVTGESFRKVLTPREDGRAVQLPRALRAGAIVLWRTHVEEMPEEAEAITTLALADMIATAGALRGDPEWLVVIDEFGSVLTGKAARRALGILGRARSAGGQAIVVTQSAADVPTATENPAMLESLSDNFGAFVIHRQVSAESREWVAKLMGTKELWQSTDRTTGGGRFAEGTGSRRRAREFRVRPDELKELAVGQAYVWAPMGPAPRMADVAIPPPLAPQAAVDKESAYGYAGARGFEEYEAPAAPKTAKRERGPDATDSRKDGAEAESPESDSAPRDDDPAPRAEDVENRSADGHPRV